MIDLKKAVKAAFCGLSAALSAALLFAGSILYIFSYAVPMLLGLVIFMINKTFGRGYAAYVYIAVSLLSLLFVPEKETVMMYALFFGYYPIVKPFIEKFRMKFIRVILKFILFNASVATIELICVYVFGIPFFENGTFSSAMLIFFSVAMNIAVIMYELLLKSFTVLYEKRIEGRIKNLLK